MLVRPDDPYEFVGLLQGQRMVALRRNQALQALAERVQANEVLGDALKHSLDADWSEMVRRMQVHNWRCDISPGPRRTTERAHGRSLWR